MASQTMALRVPPLGLLFLILFLRSASLVSAQLPYSPTRLFLSSSAGKSGKTIVYQLDPASSSAPAGSLRSITLEANLNAASLPYNTITSSLPFLQADPSVAALSSQNPDGGISTYAGGCTAGAQSAQLWRFTPDNSSATGQGTWTPQSLNPSNTQTQIAPNFLASSITFSPSTLEKDASIFAFGGMCPNQPSPDASTWTTDATYTNKLVQLQPSASSSTYSGQIMAGLAQPIAEAGFSITPLTPAFSNSTTGVVTQQQNFLLLGGHTQSAFINMSQVALFSLPEAGWTFLPIYDVAAKTDLRTRASPMEIEPRSGHTAILSSDGTKVVVLGGWVGSIATPADPQIAVLEVGTGYGGSSPSWTWTVLVSQDTPFHDGSGIYGHGAVLLPGNVMMVTGGYTIAAPSAQVKREAQSPTYFFNITSGTFLDSYSPSLAASSPAPAAQVSQGPLTTSSQKAGLGVGLTLGLLAVALAVLFGWMYWRKLKRHREYQAQFTEKTSYSQTYDGRASMAQLTDAASHTQMLETHPALRHGVWNGSSVESNEFQEIGQTRPQSVWSGLRGAERTGLDLDVPSPNRGLRKGRGPLTSHAVSQMDPRLSRNSGAISPIDELPEHERPSSESSRIRCLSPFVEEKNPFRDPTPEPLRIHTDAASRQGLHLDFPLPPGGIHHDERQRDMQLWMRDWKASDLASRRGSPDKSDRTSSTLSEQSQPQVSSWRNSAYLQYLPAALNPFLDPKGSQSPSPDHSEGHDQRHDLFYTAQTSLHDLPETRHAYSDLVANNEAEGGTLLGQQGHSFAGSQSVSSPILPDTEPTFTYPIVTHHSPSQGHAGSRPARRSTGSSRLGSWVGSVRRTLANPTASYQRSSSMNSISAANYMSNNYHNPTGGLVDADQYADEGSASTHGGRSASSSPTKPSNPRHRIKRKPISPAVSTSVQRPEPRRVLSDSAQTGNAYWAERRRALAEHKQSELQAAMDDLHGADTSLPDQDKDSGLGGGPLVDTLGLPANEAREQRRRSGAVEEIVQKRVLFNLPQGRLRVVNQGDDDGEGDSAAGVVTAAPPDKHKELSKVGQRIKRLEEASAKAQPPAVL